MDRAKAFACCLIVLCGCSRPARIVVASKNFTEQLVLGEIIAQHLEKKLNVPIDRRLNLGGTLLAQQALITGAIDLYPEYTGTALTTILKKPLEKNPDAVLATVRDEYAKRFNIKWVRPFGFNNTFAMVVRREDAVPNLSAAASRTWRLGVGYEFLKRPDGYDGMVRTYGLRLQGAPVTMDLGLLYTALKNRQVDMVAANSTDGMLSVLDAVVLDDNKHYFPPYECAAVVRQDTLDRFPSLWSALEQLSGRLTNEKMRRLNYAVDGEHRPLREVAASFLKSEIDTQ